MRKIFIIYGKSGTGKSTVLKSILKECPELKLMREYTTRRRRHNSSDDEYVFTNIEQMHQFMKDDRILEARTFIKSDEKTVHYFTLKYDPNKNEMNVISTSPHNIESFINYYGKENIILIQTSCSNTARFERLKRRGSDNPIEEIRRRYIQDDIDFEAYPHIPNLVIDTEENSPFNINRSLKELIKQQMR